MTYASACTLKQSSTTKGRQSSRYIKAFVGGKYTRSSLARVDE
jgi:hypothetical protein